MKGKGRRSAAGWKENGAAASWFLAESESNQREDGRSQNGGRFGLSLAKRGEVAGLREEKQRKKGILGG